MDESGTTAAASALTIIATTPDVYAIAAIPNGSIDGLRKLALRGANAVVSLPSEDAIIRIPLRGCSVETSFHAKGRKYSIV